MVEHYHRHGITAVELMPVHQFVHDSVLQDRGLTNYWGYNTIGFFAPHNDYSSAGQNGQQVQEFKATVKALHAAGLEVILDVVYNHTAEGNHLGPTLSFRGIDNAAYYRLVDGDAKHYYDTTGTGNTLLMRSPHVLQMIMDSLRYWVIEMHVDGFRFDLASSLARQFHEVDRLSAFFDLVQQDPVISQVKLIAEPWDVGEGGYNVGGFPPLWTEWNGKYRDTVRDFWRGQEATLGEFASRITGSADLYEQDGRRPYASINFVTAHDGFTLHDLVSYNTKHNDANGEGGQDGETHNSSWNCGVEGETDDLEVVALREQQKRNFMTTLFLSQGVPMLLHGDEIGRTQGGNNNVYAQDNPTSWVDWERARDFEVLSDFVAKLAALRRAHPVLRRRRHFQGRGLKDEGVADIGWFTPDGEWMTTADWDSGHVRSVSVYLNVGAIPEPDSRGEVVVDDDFLLFFNGDWEAISFTAPQVGQAESWSVEVDAAAPLLDDAEPRSVKTRTGHRGRAAVGTRAEEGVLVPHLPADGRPVPVSTYRVQLHAGFTFDDAAAIASYLADLGATHLYCSPYLQAAPGSTHGYDVVDHHALNAELGGPAAFERMLAACRRAELGIVLDVVPNHMAVSEPQSQNAAWWSLLRDGPDSPYAEWFDVDWDSRDNPGKVLVPVLGASLGDSVDALELHEDRVRYYEHELPLAPGTLVPGDVLATLAGQHYRLCPLAGRGRRAELPPVLRRDHARRRTGRAARGLRRHPRAGAASGARRGAGRAAHRPPGRAGRPAGLPGPAGRGDQRRVGRGREDPRAGRAAATGLADGRHHRLRRAQPGARPVRRPSG